MARLSDQLLVVSIFGYLLAMLGYAAEYSFGRQLATAGERTGRSGPEPELVAAAITGRSAEPGGVEAVGPGPGGGLDGGDRIGTGTRRRPGVAWLGRGAVLATLVATAAHASVVVTRGLAAGRIPWGNMYEFVLAATLAGALAWLVALASRPSLRPLGLYVALAEVLLLGLAGMVLYAAVAPLVPALDSYWLAIHVTAAAIAAGVFLTGFVAAALFLVRHGYEAGKGRFPYPLGARLPTADALERLTFRLHMFAFPVWTFAVIAGAIWAEAAWGRYWGWDPKETWAFISWVGYAGYLHARATPSVRRTTVAWIAVIAWATMLMNLFGVNIFFEGLHSYAQVE